MRLWRRTHLYLWLLIAAGCSPLVAQSTGQLTGIVRDPSGAAVPGALISLYRTGMTDPANQTTTTTEGIFHFDAISPESYRVTIEKQGFARYEVQGVTVSPGVEYPLNGIMLSLGSQPTVVSTTEKSQGVQTGNAEVATTLTTEQLEDLPVLNRDPLALVYTQAGVVGVGYGSSAVLPTVVDGLITSVSNVTLDSINIQDNLLRSYGLDYLPNNITTGQVSQFTLVTSNQSAIYGGGVTQTAFVSPSGTNALHGSVFYLNSNDLMNADYWFNNWRGEHDAYKSNQGGFTVGGPLIKDKLFGYANYELFRERDSLGMQQSVPSEDLHNVLLNPGFTVAPAVSKLLNALPYPNVAGTFSDSVNPFGVSLPFGSYDFQQRYPADSDNALVRVDYVRSQRNTFTGSWAWNRYNFGLQSSSEFGVNPGVVWRSKANLISLSWRFSATQRLTNEVRFGVNQAPVAVVNTERTTPYNLFLYPLDLEPISNYGNQGRAVATWGFQDNASYVAGRHNLQFGFQTQLVRIKSYIEYGSVPTVYLGSNGAQDTLDAQVAAAQKGDVFYIAQTLNPVNRNGAFGAVPDSFHPALDNYAPYIQDKWRITPRLSFTIGVRYEYYTPVRDNTGLLYTPALVNGSVTQTIASPTETFNLTSKGLYAANKNNFAPTVGVAFDPFGDGRTALRAAYSIAYVNDDLPVAAVNTNINSVLGGVSQFVNTTVSNLPQLAARFSGASITTPAAQTQTIYVIDPNLRTPYVQQWSASVQREFAGFTFDLRYVGNHGTKLLREDALVYGNNVGVYTSNNTSSNYNALQFDVSRRLRKDLQFQANYTFARALDNTNVVASYYLDPFRDQNNHALDYGPSLYDIRQAFKTNVIYYLPWKAQTLPKPVSAAIAGWSVSAIMVAQSGTPFSILAYYNGSNLVGINQNGSVSFYNPYVTADTSLQGSALSNVIHFNMTADGPSIIAPSAINQIKTSPFYGTGLGFSTQAFFDPPGNSPGQTQPRSFFGPASFDWDLGIQKRFHVTERQTLEFRGVAVNVLNHASFYFPNQYIGSAGFGSQYVYTVYSPRRVQLSLCYRF